METTVLREARSRGAHPAVAGGDLELLVTDGDGGNVDVEDEDPRRGSTALDRIEASRPKLQGGFDGGKAQMRACNRTGFNLKGRRRIDLDSPATMRNRGPPCEAWRRRREERGKEMDPLGFLEPLGRA